MIGWIRYLVYITSFFFPPAGAITFWVFTGRNEEFTNVGKWSFFWAFAGLVVCAIIIIIGWATGRMFWPRWRW